MTEAQRQRVVGMLVQFIPLCVILHVLFIDGNSTNRGFTNNSKTAFKEGRLEQKDSFYSQLMH